LPNPVPSYLYNTDFTLLTSTRSIDVLTTYYGYPGRRFNYSDTCKQHSQTVPTAAFTHIISHRISHSTHTVLFHTANRHSIITHHTFPTRHFHHTFCTFIWQANTHTCVKHRWVHLIQRFHSIQRATQQVLSQLVPLTARAFPFFEDTYGQAFLVTANSVPFKRRFSREKPPSHSRRAPA